MRSRVSVKFNCLVLLFVSVGYSNELSAEYRRAHSSKSLHPFGYSNTSTSSRTLTRYKTNGGKKTSSSRWGSSGSLDPFSKTSMHSRPTVTHSNNVGTVKQRKTIQKPGASRNGVKSCNVFQSQATKTHYQYANILLKITTGICINTIILKLQENLEFRNEKFNVCTCQNHGNCRCTGETSTYTITKPVYCLCLEEKNGESKCVCNPHILEIQITSTTILEGCMCYNSGGTGTSLKCYCRQIWNESKYDINKYTSLEIKIGNEHMAEGFGTAIYSKFSPQDRDYDFIRCTKLPTCGYQQIKYSHNSIFQCLCVDDRIYANWPISCTCNPYILQPKIKYDGKLDLQACKCISTNAESFCSCKKYLESGQTPQPQPQPYNAKGVFDLIPLGNIGIEALRQYFKDKDQFRNEHIITCTCRFNGRKLECNCDKWTTEYKMTNPGYCLCIDPKPNWNRAGCLCNIKILTPILRYNRDMYVLKGCICVHNIRSRNALDCICRDIEAESKIHQMKYSSTEVVLPSVKTTISQIRDIVIPKFEEIDRQYDICSGLSGLSNCNLHYPYNGLAPCLCLKGNYPYPNKCICNQYMLQLKIRYNPEVIPLQACNCVPTDEQNRAICKCGETIHQTSTISTTTRKPGGYKRYIYENVLIILPEKAVTISVIRQEFFNTVEFSEEQFNVCACVPKGHYNYGCSCTESTKVYTKQKPGNCLCVHSYVRANSKEECLCNKHILKPAISYSKFEIYLLDCSCYNTGGNLNSLTCDCKPKPPYSPNYGLVLINIKNEVRIDIEILLEYFIETEEYHLERFNTYTCTGQQEKRPCSCLKHYYQSTQHKTLNCLCIVYHRTLPQLPQCLCSDHVLLADITYDSSIELQECVCNNSGTKDPICNCKRKNSFNPNYHILIEIVNQVTITNILQEFKKKAVFRHEHFTECKYLNNYVTCSPEVNKELYTSQNQSFYNCLCIHPQKNNNATDCLCSHHVTNPAITYNIKTTLLQACICEVKDSKCSCKNQPSFQPRYDRILMEFREVTIDITIIMNFLKERWEFQYEVFNQCKGNNLKSPLTLSCTEKTQECTENNHCNCLCVFNQTISATECLCSPHVLLSNITYSTTVNNLQGCACFYKDNDHQMTCNCVKKRSLEPQYNLILMEFQKVKINTHIIRKYLQQRWEFGHEVFNHCKGTSLKSPLALTCKKNIQSCTEKNHCSCLCVFSHKTSVTKCLCSAHILLPNITYSTAINDLQGCSCFHKSNTNQLTCNCVKKPSFEPEYDLILIGLRQMAIHINIILTYLEQRWEFQHEVFNLCKGSNLKSPLQLTCIEQTQECKGKNVCNCLCVFDQATTECLCSPHILRPNITYSTTLNNIQGCTCLHKGDANQIECNCLKKPSFEPRYDLILIEWSQIKIDITIILTYLQQRWEFRHEVFNLCSGTSLKSSLVLACKEETQSCTEKNKCNCLCVFHIATNAAECLCNPHILQPNITYSTTTNDLQGCACIYNGDSKLLTCDCGKKLSFEPKYDILIEWSEVRIDITIILTYLQQRSEFQYEVFNQCHGSEFQAPLLLSCTEKTEIYTGNNQYNCLCVIHQANQKNSEVECLCSTHVLLPNIKYSTSLNNLQGCKCLHKGDAHQLSCDCEKKPTFEPKYDLIAIDLHEVEINITIILTYLQQRWEFQYEEFNQCSGSNLNKPLILSCSQNTEIYTANNRYNCLCVFHHATSTTDCLCSTHMSLVTFTYNVTSNDLQICNCQNKGGTTQLTCDCEKKESFQPRYEFILIDTGKFALAIESILEYFTARWEFHYETFSKLNCKNSILPLSCTWEDNKALTTKEASFNCLCVLSNIKKEAARCLCSQHILIPDITYNMNDNNLQSCKCHYNPKNCDPLTCKCSTKDSFIPKYGQIELNFYLKNEIKITFVLEYLKNTMEFRNEQFNLCSCTKTNRVVSCNCENDTKLLTVTKPGECLCTWSSYNNKAECLCSAHIMEVKYKFSSELLKLGYCLCHSIGTDIRSLVCDCDEMMSADKRYLNFIIQAPSELEGIMDVANLISANFTRRDKMFDICTNINYGDCLNSTPGSKSPCLCVDSDFGVKNGCACGLYIVQPMILYSKSAYKLYRCSFDTKWNCKLVDDEVKVAEFSQSIRIEPEIKIQKTIVYVNRTFVIPNTSSINITYYVTNKIIKQVKTYVTSTNVSTVYVPGQRTITSYRTRSVRVKPLGYS